MGCVLQGRLEDSPRPHAEPRNSLRLLRRAMGKERPEHQSRRRKRRTVWNFRNQLCRYVATRTSCRPTHTASAGRQELQSSGHAAVSEQLEEHRPGSWPELVIALGRKRQDGVARRIRHELSGSGLVQRRAQPLHRQQPGTELHTELRHAWSGCNLFEFLISEPADPYTTAQWREAVDSGAV